MTPDKDNGCDSGDMPESDLILDNVSHYVLGAIYLLLFGLAIYHRLQRSNQMRRMWQHTFFIALLLGILLRAIWAICQPLIVDKYVTIPNAINLIMQTLPSFLFFSCYLIIIFLWAEIYHNMFHSFGADIHRLRPIYFGTQAAMYLTLITLEVCDMLIYSVRRDCPKPDVDTPLQKAIWCLNAGLYICSALGFLIYGGRFYFRFSKERKPLLHQMKRSVLPKVKTLTLVLSCVFVIRGGMTLSNSISNWTNNFWWIDFVYYSLLEVLPIVLMLLVLRPTTQQDQVHINQTKAISAPDVVHD